MSNKENNNQNIEKARKGIANFVTEFKDFASRGNVMDLAVGVIIGGAFSKITSSLVEGIVTPLIGALFHSGTNSFSSLKIPLWGAENAMDVGLFITAVLNFFFTALTIFLLLKFIRSIENPLKKRIVADVPPPLPTTQTCPFCQNTIPIKATRCGFCTSHLAENTTEA